MYSVWLTIKEGPSVHGLWPQFRIMRRLMKRILSCGGSVRRVWASRSFCPNTHQMCVFALKTIPNSDPQLNDGVDGVDLFELTYDVRLERTPSTGFYGFGDISVQRVLSGSSNEGLELHHMSYPAEVGMCSLTGTVTISNNSGKDFTINGEGVWPAAQAWRLESWRLPCHAMGCVP